MSSKREEAKCFLRRLYRCNSSLLEYKKGLEGLQEITTENQSDDLPLDHTEKVEKYQKALEQKIVSIIEKVSDATLKTLLHCRYIDFMKWDDVAVKIGCYKALKKALTESTCSLEDVVPGTDLTVYDGVADEFDIEDTVLNPIANDQVNAEIWESVNGLSPRLKNVIELRYKNGLTQSDVAKELGVSGSRIAQCEHQAYKLLKADARMRYAAEYYGYDSSITYFGGKAFYKQHGSSTEYIALNHIEAETKLKQINEYFENIDWAI